MTSTTMHNSILMDKMTSGGGARTPKLKIIAICLLVVIGGQPTLATTATYSMNISTEQTDANIANMLTPSHLALAQTTGEAVHELRQRSGLTWEEIGDLFGVSRRSIHHWASGAGLAADHERHVRAVLGVVRQADRGEARKTRDALLMIGNEGNSAFSLLKTKNIKIAAAMLGNGIVSTKSRIVLSAVAREARSGPRATDYLGAMEAPLLPKIGKERIVRVHRAKR